MTHEALASMGWAIPIANSFAASLPPASLTYSLLAVVLILIGSTAVVVRQHSRLRDDCPSDDR